ncbi:MAG: membrane protein insertion efficiency factor YidD [bacterium]
MGRTIAVWLIRLYQRLSHFTPRVCRFQPSCSEYAAQAITRYGFLKGTRMGIWRILRCNPFNPGGSDPVL